MISMHVEKLNKTINYVPFLAAKVTLSKCISPKQIICMTVFVDDFLMLYLSFLGILLTKSANGAHAANEPKVTLVVQPSFSIFSSEAADQVVYSLKASK